MHNALCYRGKAAGALVAPARSPSPRAPALEVVTPPVVARFAIPPTVEDRASCSRSIHHPARIFKPP